MRKSVLIPLFFIAIFALAACKSTMPQSESLLEMSVKSEKDSTVIFDRIKSYVFDSVKTDMTTNFNVTECICCHCAPSTYLWGDVQYDSTQVHLDMTSSDLKYQFILIIEKGIAIAGKKYTDYGKEKINELCVQHKSDSTKKNVNCVDNTINFTFKDDFSGYDLSQLGQNFLYGCHLRTSRPTYSCAWWVKFPCERMERNKETPPLEDDL